MLEWYFTHGRAPKIFGSFGCGGRHVSYPHEASAASKQDCNGHTYISSEDHPTGRQPAWVHFQTNNLQGCIAHLRRPSFDISYPVLQGAKDGQQTGFVAIRMEHANQIQLQNAKAYVAATSDPPTLCRRNTKCLEDEEATVARTRATFPIVGSSAHSRCLAASFYFVVR